MGLFSALLPVVGGLLGARSEAKARARSDYMNSPQGIRANAEAAGFNPLVFAGPGTGTGAQYAPQMGSIIANAFASASNAWTREKELEIANQQLELERDRLQQAVERATLQPNVGGIYGREQSGQRERSVGNTSAPPVTGSDGVDRADPRDTGIYDRRYGPLRILANPNTTGAEETEERYGDIAQEVGGVATILSDVGYTFGRMFSDYRQDRYFRGLYQQVNPERVPEVDTTDYLPVNSTTDARTNRPPIRRTNSYVPALIPPSEFYVSP